MKAQKFILLDTGSAAKFYLQLLHEMAFAPGQGGYICISRLALICAGSLGEIGVAEKSHTPSPSFR